MFSRTMRGSRSRSVMSSPSVTLAHRAFPFMNPAELRRLREAAGFTQRTLAERLGFHPNYFAQLERGDVLVRKVVALAVRYVCSEAIRGGGERRDGSVARAGGAQ